MTAHTLPKNPYYAFSPAYGLDNDLQQTQNRYPRHERLHSHHPGRTVHARRERRTG